jgi:hypothetical protein
MSRYFPQTFVISPGGESLVVRWRTLHPRRRGLIYLPDAYSAFHQRDFLIGSAPEADLRLEHATVAPRHVRLRFHSVEPVLQTLQGRIIYNHGYYGPSGDEDGTRLNSPMKEILPKQSAEFPWGNGRGGITYGPVRTPEMQVGCYILTLFMYKRETAEFFAEEPPVYALQEAQAIETEPDRLAKLAEHPDPRVRGAVAANPNAPPQTLKSLWQEFPDEFFQNPAVTLFLLEDMSFFNDFDEKRLASVLEAEQPEWCMQMLAFGGLTLNNPSAFDKRLSVTELAAGFVRTSSALLVLLASHPEPRVRRILAENPSAPAEALARLSNDPDAKIADIGKERLTRRGALLQERVV